jgi:hypothetical protein
MKNYLSVSIANGAVSKAYKKVCSFLPQSIFVALLHTKCKRPLTQYKHLKLYCESWYNSMVATGTYKYIKLANGDHCDTPPWQLVSLLL